MNGKKWGRLKIQKRQIGIGAVMFVLFLGLILGNLLSPETCHAVTYAYVADSASDSILVIRTSDRTVIESIPVGANPYGVAVSPYGDRVFVSNRDDATVSVIDTSSLTVADTVSVGLMPSGLAVSPDGYYVYVANYGDNTVSMIQSTDEDENAVIATIEVGEGPLGAAVDPENDYAYVTNSLGNSVSVITSYADPVTVAVGTGPAGIASDPEGDYVYVANRLDNSVSVISIEGSDRYRKSDDNAVTKIIPVGDSPWGIAVGNGGDTVYVTNKGDNSVSVISGVDHTVTAVVSAGTEPAGVSIAKNGTDAFIVSENRTTISVVHAADYSVDTIVLDEAVQVSGFGAFAGGSPPAPPSDIEVTEETDEAIELSWADNAFDETGYKVERRTFVEDDDNDYDDEDDDFTVVAILGSNAASYTDTGLAEDTIYEYRVRSFNEGADSYAVTIYGMTDAGDETTTSCFVNAGAQDAFRHFLFLSGICSVILLVAINEKVPAFQKKKNKFQKSAQEGKHGS